MHALRPIARLARTMPRPLAYALAFALPPILVIAASILVLAASALSIDIGPAFDGGRRQKQLEPPALDRPLPAPPAHDPAKRTALIVAGNAATESSDLLGPYEVLATSGAFNMYVVAPERRLTPLTPGVHCCGAVDLVPHYSFAEYDRAIGTVPDLVVVPQIPHASTRDTAVLTWLRERPGEQTVILSICIGAKVVADAGLLAGHRATSHHAIMPLLEVTHPEVNWARGLRYVEDGRFVSAAGVTSGVDATLDILRRFLGRSVADETARRMGYPHTRFLDDPSWRFAEINHPAVMPYAFRWGRTEIGLVLYSGLREIELSSIVDTYPRSTSSDVHAIAPEREFVRTAHGLDLLPRFDLASAPRLDRVLIPGHPDAALTATVERWAAAQGRAVERIHASGGYPYDVTFRDLAQQETRLVAEYVAAWLEYPVAPLALEGADWPLPLLLRAVALGMLGVVAAWGIPRLLRTRRPRVTSAA